MRRRLLASILLTPTVVACLVSVDESLVDRVPEDGGAEAAATDRREPPVDVLDAASDGGRTIEAKCPDGHGARMVPLDDFCIDERETTVADYRAFLGADLGEILATRPSVCSFKTSYEPDEWPAPVADNGLPVNQVDWCDAWAYCAWAGKRLCGGSGGAALGFDLATEPTDEWRRACTNERTTTFPYGSGYDASVCNVVGYRGTNALLSPGSATGCHGLAPSLSFVTDLVGNVAEWVRSCQSDDLDASEDDCRLRGGSYYSVTEDGCNDANYLPRGARSRATGIRCCATAR